MISSKCRCLWPMGRSALWACLFLGTVSCGGGDDGPVEIDDLCEALISDACNAVLTCPDIGMYFDYRDQEQCQSDLPCRGYDDFKASVDNGWLTYNAEAMGKCHAMLKDDPCGAAAELVDDSVHGVLFLCPDTIERNQLPGDPCLNFVDCTEGSHCHIADSCPGECIELAALGDPCDEDNPEIFCNELNSHICVNGYCQQRFGNGESCADDSFGCQDGLICSNQLGTDTDPVCQPLGKKGDPCGGSNHCEPDLVCFAENAEAEEEFCGDPLEKGAYCEWHSQCKEPLTCIEEKCTDRPGAGEACTSFLFGGDNCAGHTQCEDNVCKTNRYVGESCNEELEACAESRCVDGTCEERLEDGAACESGYDCHSRSCRDEICVDPSLCEQHISD